HADERRFCYFLCIPSVLMGDRLRSESNPFALICAQLLNCVAKSAMLLPWVRRYMPFWPTAWASTALQSNCPVCEFRASIAKDAVPAYTVKVDSILTAT